MTTIGAKQTNLGVIYHFLHRTLTVLLSWLNPFFIEQGYTGEQAVTGRRCRS